MDFQEPDAWFHLRTAHNLLAHFPFRSGFDPYALFPDGMNVPTGPLWDYMIAFTAWIIGFGSPSPGLIDRLAAWLPAILGAVTVLPVYWISRKLFGLTAALFAALWIAVTPGEFVWLTHLGNADHHAAEGLFSLLVLCFLAAAVELSSVVRAILAGVSLGALLATQPAAVFEPAMLAAAVLVAPSLAGPCLTAYAAAAIVMVPVKPGLYTGYDWLALASGAAITLSVRALDLLHVRKGWPSWTRWIAAAGAVALTAGVAQMRRPHLIPGLVSEISTLNKSDVAELQPVIVVSRSVARNFDEMNLHLGIVWMAAIPCLIWLLIFAFRRQRASITALAVFALAFTIAAFLHLRMILYYTPVACILAGALCAWLMDFAESPRFRLAVGAVIAITVLGVNIPATIKRMTSQNSGAGNYWQEALVWLRQHSPDPFGNDDVWNQYFPRREGGQTPTVPTAAYGIGVWWDTGYMVENISHRIPTANGFGAGVEEQGGQIYTRDIGQFYASLFPESELSVLRRMKVRYVIVDPTIPAFPTMVGRSKFDVIEKMAGSDSAQFYRTLWHDEAGYRKPMFVYYADYYNTMGVRLFLNDGKAAHGTGPVVFRVQSDGVHDVITRAVKFVSARAAGDFAASHSNENLVVGCDDPVVSCFDVEAVRGLHRVFTSDPSPISIRRGIHAVKIFEVEPDSPGQSR